MVEFFQSKSGKLSARYNNVFLNSSYDPLNEAEKFLSNTVRFKNPGTLIILGETLGYIHQAAKKAYPKAKIISIFFSIEFKKKTNIEINNAWYPGTEESIGSFFSRTIDDLDIEELEIIQWPACMKCFKEESKTVFEILHKHIKELNGNINTTHAFGKLWIKNAFQNFFNIDSFINIEKTEKPVLILASGPSLKDSLDAVKKLRDLFFIIALPSSLRALIYHEIIPDVLATSDPGYYADMHLSNIQHSSYAIPIAAPLSASTGISRTGSDVLLLSNNFFFENSLALHLNFPPMDLPPNGTVAGTALELALKLSKNEIFFLGLDLCYSDINMHVAPHTFDELFIIKSNRFNPYIHAKYSLSIKGTKKISKDPRTTLPLETYADWFGNNIKSKKQDIFRVNPSPVKIPWIKEISFNDFKNIKVKNFKSIESAKSCNKYKNSEIIKRKKIIENILYTWINGLNESKEIIKNTKDFKNISFKNFFNLLYSIDTHGFIKIKKHLRETGNIETTYLIDESIEKVNAFLRRLLKRFV